MCDIGSHEKHCYKANSANPVIGEVQTVIFFTATLPVYH